jgi:hypothetical protein
MSQALPPLQNSLDSLEAMPVVRPIVSGADSRHPPRRARARKLTSPHAASRPTLRVTSLATAQDPPWRPRLRAGYALSISLTR